MQIGGDGLLCPRREAASSRSLAGLYLVIGGRQVQNIQILEGGKVRFVESADVK